MKSRRARTAAATGKAARLAKALQGRNALSGARNPVHIGTKVKSAFTILNGKRYAAIMLLAAAAILAATTQQNAQPEHKGAAVQAVATVRVISGTRLSLDGANNGRDVPIPRNTLFTTGGVEQPAKLIEFQ